MDGIKLFLSPQGRIGRRLYAVAMIAVVGVQIVSLTVPLIDWLIFPLLNYPGICLVVKRLHDANRSGFWVIAPYVVIIDYLMALLWFAIVTFGGFGTFSGGTAEDQHMGRALADKAAYMLFLMPAVFLTLIGLLPGNRTANRFGVAV